MTQAKSKTTTKTAETQAPAGEEATVTEAPAETQAPAVEEAAVTEAPAETQTPAAEEAAVTEPPAVTETPAAEVARASGLDMIAINTVGNHKPGTRFTAKDKAAFDRFILLGAAKKA